MRRVFVSYSRNNLDAVTQLIKHMKDGGIDMWYDQALTGGQRWWDNILTNIRECDIFVFALSPESWDSEACKGELSYVVQLGKPILPVLVSEGININLLSPPLSEIQITDYRKRDMEAAFAVLKAINLAPPTPALPEPLPATPPVPVSYLSTLKDRIDCAEPLSPQEQITLLFELEEELKDGRSPAETRDLLLRLKRRDELLAKIASKIDAALKTVEEKPQVPARRESRERDQRPAPRPSSCPQCGTPAQAGASFCAKCGTRVGESLTVPDVPDDGPDMERSTTKRYLCNPADTARLIADVRGWLRSQDFDSTQVNTESQGVLLEIKKRGDWRKYVGMATALNILFEQTGDTLTVEIGAGQWIDKAGAGAVGMFVFAPIAITAGYGVWEQSKMPDKIFDFIGSQLVYK
jgi:TIR domain-containing protein/zinc ribbon protein